MSEEYFKHWPELIEKYEDVLHDLCNSLDWHKYANLALEIQYRVHSDQFACVGGYALRKALPRDKCSSLTKEQVFTFCLCYQRCVGNALPKHVVERIMYHTQWSTFDAEEIDIDFCVWNCNNVDFLEHNANYFLIDYHHLGKVHTYRHTVHPIDIVLTDPKLNDLSFCRLKLGIDEFTYEGEMNCDIPDDFGEGTELNKYDCAFLAEYAIRLQTRAAKYLNRKLAIKNIEAVTQQIKTLQIITRNHSVWSKNKRFRGGDLH